MPKGRKVGSITVTLAEMSVIVKRTKEGASLKQIAQELGRSRDTVWRYRKQLLE